MICIRRLGTNSRIANLPYYFTLVVLLWNAVVGCLALVTHEMERCRSPSPSPMEERKWPPHPSQAHPVYVSRPPSSLPGVSSPPRTGAECGRWWLLAGLT